MPLDQDLKPDQRGPAVAELHTALSRLAAARPEAKPSTPFLARVATKTKASGALVVRPRLFSVRGDATGRWHERLRRKQVSYADRASFSPATRGLPRRNAARSRYATVREFRPTHVPTPRAVDSGEGLGPTPARQLEH